MVLVQLLCFATFIQVFSAGPLDLSRSLYAFVRGALFVFVCFLVSEVV